MGINTGSRSGKEEWLETEGGRISYEDSGGPGRLVVCVPGMGQLRSAYRFTLPRLVASGYRAVATDLRGMGASSPRWADYSADAIRRDLAALIRRLGAGQAVLVANSISAGAAVAVAAEAPELVAGLVLVGPVVHDLRIPAWKRALYRLALARPWGPSAWVGYQAGKLYPTSPPSDLDQRSAELLANLKERGRMRGLLRMAGSRHPGAEAMLDAVRSPVFVMMGSADPDFADPRAEGQRVADRLHGRLQMFDGVGHYPQAEVPDRFGEALLAFLGGVENGS